MKIIVDTGPLVAFLYRRERHHGWSAEQAARLPGPFYTCESVLTEAHFLLRSVPQGTRRLIELVGKGKLNLDYSYWANRDRVDELLLHYADVPMSFADACLVNMAEHLGDASILTLDHHFRIYRMQRSRALSVIIP